MTEHIASEMRLVLRSGKGKGRRALPSLPRLAVRCLPPLARLPITKWRGMGWPAPKPIRKPGAALLACSRLVRRTAYPSDVGGAEQSSVAGSRRTL